MHQNHRCELCDGGVDLRILHFHKPFGHLIKVTAITPSLSDDFFLHIGDPLINS